MWTNANTVICHKFLLIAATGHSLDGHCLYPLARPHRSPPDSISKQLLAHYLIRQLFHFIINSISNSNRLAFHSTFYSAREIERERPERK